MNQTAKYEVKVVAGQQPLPEGMSKLMEVLSSTITPLELTATNRLRKESALRSSCSRCRAMLVSFLLHLVSKELRRDFFRSLLS
jgi:hypothetical protein